MADSHIEEQERSLTLQRYLSLHDKQQNIRRRLSTSSNTSSFSLTSPTTNNSSFSVSSPLSPSEASTFTTKASQMEPSPSQSPTRYRNHIRGGFRSSTITSTTHNESAIEDTPVQTPEREPSVDGTATTAESLAAESDLVDLNNDIKATLTTLLNLPSVRHDEAGEMRVWVQERLMDAEMENRRLKRGRRRANTWDGTASRA